MRVLAVDPGGATGVALWYQDGGDRHWAANVGDVRATYAFLEQWVPTVDLVVCEDYLIGANTVKKSQDGKVSIELIGVTRYLCHKSHVPFKLQRPGDRSVATKEKLAQLGWSMPGPGDHARSASQHLLCALLERGIIDKRIFTTQ